MARAWCLCLVLFMAAAVASRLAAAPVTVKRGTLESVSAAKRSITVAFSRADSAAEVRLGADAEIRVDGKPADLESLAAPMAVTVEIRDGQAVRIMARTVKEKPPAVKSAKTARRSARRTAPKAARSGSSPRGSKLEGSAPDDAAAGPTSAIKGTVPAKKPDGGTPGDGQPNADAPWPGFLGPNRDNVSRETGLMASWPPDGPPLAWHTSGLGQGFSNVAVAGGTVYTMGTPDNEESVLAIDFASGKPLWSVPTGGTIFQEQHGNGPRGTPAVDGSRLYALGATGQLVCVDVVKKTVVWSKSLSQEFGAARPGWGFAESPLVDGPRLICTPGAPGATLAALDKDNGSVLWRSAVPGNPTAGYASPIAIETEGVRQYVNYLSRGVVGVNARDGRPLWGNDASANTPANCTTPVFVQGHVFVSSAYGGGGALLKLSANEGNVDAKLVYRTPQMKNHHGGLVAVDGYLYGADEAVLTCFGLAEGRAVWRNRSVGKCSLTYADGHLYVRSESGPVALVEANPEEYRETGRFTPPKRGTNATWAYPVVAGGRLFLRDQDDLLCYALRADDKAGPAARSGGVAKRSGRD